MASKQSTVDHLLDQLAGAGDVTARKMFGEYGIYCDGKMVALVCDDQLFVKPTEGGGKIAGSTETGAPYPNAKPHFLISPDRWEDNEWLSDLIKTTARELPLPTPKKPKKRLKANCSCTKLRHCEQSEAI